MKGGPEDRQNNVQWLRDKVAGLFTFRTDLDKKWGGNVYVPFLMDQQ